MHSEQQAGDFCGQNLDSGTQDEGYRSSSFLIIYSNNRFQLRGLYRGKNPVLAHRDAVFKSDLLPKDASKLV